MADEHIHLIPKLAEPNATKAPAEMVKLGEQTKLEPAADEDDKIFTLCCLAKIRAESTRYWNGVKQYRSRMRKVPVKRVFSPMA